MSDLLSLTSVFLTLVFGAVAFLFLFLKNDVDDKFNKLDDKVNKLDDTTRRGSALTALTLTLSTVTLATVVYMASQRG